MALIPHRIVEWLQNQRQPMPLDLSEARRALPAAPVQLAAEAVAPQLFTLTTGDAEDPAFRRITSPATLRDLNPLMHDRMLQVCYFLRVTTPFGKRIVEVITSYVVGKGVRVTAKDPAVQDVIDDFWKDEVNHMDQTCRDWCDELTTFGELCIPLVVNPVSGKVRLGYIDPMNIDTIQFAEMKTQNTKVGISFAYAVHVRREVGEKLGPPMEIVRRVDDPNNTGWGTLQGECFYFALNKAKSASRGFSELFSLADWIDVFDQMIFDFADKVRFLNSFVWHYTVEGADDKQTQKFKDQLTKEPPKQGGVQVTNEKVKIEAQTPDFKGEDMSAGAQMVKLYGLGGAGLPAWFFADGENANKAIAEEMSGPTGKKIQDRQNHLGECLTRVLDFVIEKAVEAGVLSQAVDRSYRLEFPELAAKDLAKAGTTLGAVSTALATGVDEGWICNETAARAFHTVLGEIGVDIDDSKGEFDQAQQEKNDRAAQSQTDLFAQGQLAQALQGKLPALPAPKAVAQPDPQAEPFVEA